MKKILVASLAYFFPAMGLAEEWITHSDTVVSIDIWPSSATDDWGIKFSPTTQAHSTCPDGFYVPLEAKNKDVTYSAVLTALSADKKVAVQFKPSMALNGSCKANRVTLKK
ncbi:hypothetical protein [Microbulbifer sp. DLAB2-AA]|uniref:hypothetical protein n=1 Tax=Microbulbifer sp. DLAB2-AA TaxID=3243394 RepID=UPI004039FA36